MVAEFMNKSGYNASWASVSSYHNESILHDGGWRVLSRRCETALAFKNSRSLTAGVWWRPRCTASSAWASGRWRARLSVRLWSCMCVWLCSTASPSSGAQQRGLCLPWHSCVWSWGHLVCLPTCATKPTLCTPCIEQQVHDNYNNRQRKYNNTCNYAPEIALYIQK